MRTCRSPLVFHPNLLCHPSILSGQLKTISARLQRCRGRPSSYDELREGSAAGGQAAEQGLGWSADATVVWESCRPVTNHAQVAPGVTVGKRLAEHLGTLSQFCTALATVCVVAVLVPVIRTNASLLSDGNLSAVSAEVWQDLLQDVFAFSGLSSVFVGLCEAGSSVAHATGAVLYTAVFIQLFLAGAAPPILTVMVAVLAVTAVAANGAKVLGWLEGGKQGLWFLWTDALAVLGWMLVPFLFCHNFLAGVSWWPSLVGGVASAGVVAAKRLSLLHPAAAGFWDRNGLALAATATFMMEGAAELVKLLQDSSGYLPQHVMLNTGFVALLIPRSLFTQDSMFFIDITWNAVLGWGQLLVLYGLRRQLTGQSYLAGPTFALCSVGFAALLGVSLYVANVKNSAVEETPDPAATPAPWTPAVRLVAFPFQQLARFAVWLWPTRGAVLFRLPARQRLAAYAKQRRRKQSVPSAAGRE